MRGTLHPFAMLIPQKKKKNRYLKSLGAPIDGIEYRLPDITPESGIYVVDTRLLFSALEGRPGETRGLSRMCALLQVQNLDRLHNAGNDSHVCILFFFFFFCFFFLGCSC